MKHPLLNQSSIILIALLCVSVSAYSQSKQTIGAVLPLTGEFASVGSTLRQGLEFATRQLGHTLVVEDDGGLNPIKAITAVRKLIDVDHVAIILISSHDLTPALSPILTAARIPGVIIWDSSLELKDTYPYVFSIGYLPEQAGAILGDFAIKDLKASKIAMVSCDLKWSTRISLAFRQTVRGEQRSIIYDESFPQDTLDFRASITRIVKHNPDLIFAPLYSQALVTFIKQLRNLGYRGSILTGEVLFGPEIASLGDHANGIYMTNAWLSATEIAQISQNHRQPTIPDTARYALASDAILFAHQYLNLLGNCSRSSGCDPLTAIRAAKVIGQTGTIDFSHGKISPRYQPIVQIQGNNFTLVKDLACYSNECSVNKK